VLVGTKGEWVVNKRIALNVVLIHEILVQTVWLQKNCEKEKSEQNPML